MVRNFNVLDIFHYLCSGNKIFKLFIAALLICSTYTRHETASIGFEQDNHAHFVKNENQTFISVADSGCSSDMCNELERFSNMNTSFSAQKVFSIAGNTTTRSQGGGGHIIPTI